MADISTPNDPATKVEGSVGDQDTTQKNDSELQSGAGTTVKGPGTPPTKGKTEEERKETREWLKTVFMVLTFAVTCIAISFSCFSYFASKRSATAAEHSAAAAQRNADTAEKAFKTTTENFQLDQRAWVGIRGIQHPTEVKEGAKWVFKVNGTNSGKTSAQNVKTILATQATLKDDPFTPTFGEQTLASTNQSIGTIAAGATIYPMTKEMRPTKEQSEAFSQGIITVYVYGEISYDDVFNHPHCTRYCFYFVSDFSNANVCETYNQETNTKCGNIK